jgi:hypothetical protein
MSMFRSRLKVRMMMELPRPEIDQSWLMPSTVLMASSRGRDTCDSISSGEAPDSVVSIRTVGKSTDGKRSTPNFI